MTYGGFHKKKRRSKQKNLKKDTRPENLRPGGADYVPPEKRPGYVAPPQPPAEKSPKNKEAANNLELEDINLNCRDCAESFVFSSRERKTYAKKGFASFPTRCKSCRETKRASNINDSSEITSVEKKSKSIKRSGELSGVQNLAKKTKLEEKLGANVSAGDRIEDKQRVTQDVEPQTKDTEEVESSASSVEETPTVRFEDGSVKEKEDDAGEKSGSDAAEEADPEESWGSDDYWGNEEAYYDPRDDEICGQELEPFDLCETLELPPGAMDMTTGTIKGGPSRLRACYHKLSRRYHPDSFRPVRSGNATPVDTQRKAAAQRFRRVTIAFEALKVAQSNKCPRKTTNKHSPLSLVTTNTLPRIPSGHSCMPRTASRALSSQKLTAQRTC